MPPHHPDSELPTISAAASPTLAVTTEPVQLAPGGLDESGFADRYHRDELLGRGGMGEVFLCRDARIGRRVALKQLHAAPGTSSAAADRARFMREARIQAQLEHPAVVPVYELGRTPEGAEFFTMKRVRGRTLADVLAELAAGAPDAAGRYSLRRLLTAFSSVCLAVQYAHERGVLHRDLKPANLMLGDFGEVYVLDWGVARLAGEAEDGERIDVASDGVHTVAGSICGTPGYSAPEQVSGRATDRRSDVYALGAILFEILALEPLQPRAGLAQMVTETVAGVDARVSLRVPGRETPPELEALCVRATALDPADRIGRALDLHQAVERFLDGDRDLQLRRQLAADHAAAAEAAAERALAGGDIAERERALAEVGRAIALDPDHAAGAATLMRLLTEPPREIPAEVQREISREQDEEIRSAGRLGGAVYASSLLMLFPIIAAGILSWGCLAVTLLLTAMTALWMYFGSRAEQPSTLWMMGALLFASAALGSAGTVFGVYTVLPGFIAGHAVAFSVGSNRLPRWLPIAGAWLAVLVPVGLESIGLLPAAHAFEGGTIEILPRMVAFPGAMTELLLLSLTLVVVALPALYAQRHHQVLTGAQARLHMQAWQLRRILPPAR